MPLAPPEIKTVTHVKFNKQLTLKINGKDGCYVGQSINHYRCVQYYFLRTAVRDCDTVSFFPTTVTFSDIKLPDFFRQTASDILTILTQPPSTTTPSLAAGDPVRNALLKIATQLQCVDKIPEQQNQPPTPSPRVTPTKIPIHTLLPTVVPRVVTHDTHTPTSIPTKYLHQHSIAPKKSRFKN